MLNSVAEFFGAFVEGGLGSDSESEDPEEKRLSGSGNGKLSLPYPGKILKIPKTVSQMPPACMRRRHPDPGEKITRKNTGSRKLPGGGTIGHWVPPGCGCWLDKSKLIRPMRRGKTLLRPKCMLTPCQMHMLVDSLPSHCKWVQWTLAFSSDEHGSSLHALQEKLMNRKQYILLVKSTAGDVFGAFMSHAPDWAQPGRYIGSAETYVFHFMKGALQCYHWGGRDPYFISTMSDGAFGVGGGTGMAFFIDADLRKGRSVASSTFESPPLYDASEGGEQHFTVSALEVWDFESHLLPMSPAHCKISLLNDRSSPTPSLSPVNSRTDLDELVAQEETTFCQYHLSDPEHHLCLLHG